MERTGRASVFMLKASNSTFRECPPLNIFKVSSLISITSHNCFPSFSSQGLSQSWTHGRCALLKNSQNILPLTLTTHVSVRWSLRICVSINISISCAKAGVLAPLIKDKCSGPMCEHVF